MLPGGEPYPVSKRRVWMTVLLVKFKPKGNAEFYSIAATEAMKTDYLDES
jgi:hypothetical protein